MPFNIHVASRTASSESFIVDFRVCPPNNPSLKWSGNVHKFFYIALRKHAAAHVEIIKLSVNRQKGKQ